MDELRTCSIVYTLLERGVKPPLCDQQRYPGRLVLYSPCDIVVEPHTLGVVDFSVAVKLPPGYGGLVDLKPYLLGRYTQARVLGQRLDSKGTYPLSVFVENLSPVNSLKFYQGLAYFEFVVYKLPLVELVESEEGRAAGMREEARAEAEAQAKEDLEREVAELAEVPKNLPEGPRPTMLHVRTLQASVAAGEAAEIAAGGPKTTAAETREFLVTSATCKVFRQKDNNEEYMQQTQEFSDLSDADMDDEEIEMALAADSPKSPQPGVQNKASTKPTAEALGEKTKEAADTDIGRDGGGSDKGSRSLRPPQPKRGGVLDNPTETATPKVSRQTSAPGKGPRTPPPSRRSRSPAAGATPTPRGATAFARGDARGDQEDLAGGGKERAEAEKKDKN